MKKAKKAVVDEEAEVSEKVPCADCNGSGLKDSLNLCPSCEGHG